MHNCSQSIEIGDPIWLSLSHNCEGLVHSFYVPIEHEM